MESLVENDLLYDLCEVRHQLKFERNIQTLLNHRLIELELVICKIQKQQVILQYDKVGLLVDEINDILETLIQFATKQKSFGSTTKKSTTTKCDFETKVGKMVIQMIACCELVRRHGFTSDLEKTGLLLLTTLLRHLTSIFRCPAEWQVCIYGDCMIPVITSIVKSIPFKVVDEPNKESVENLKDIQKFLQARWMRSTQTGTQRSWVSALNENSTMEENAVGR